MKRNIRTAQAGYALLLTVLALMGIGGYVLVGYTQNARQVLEEKRYQHNQRVLKQAKQALLMFAYNYPKTNVGEGPGKLLCPDFDNDGDVDAIADCNNIPGRFPWSDPRLNTERLVDASGETLWYAVSDAFYNLGGGGVINYDTTGTITLVDQSGGIIYDGNGAGIAAVIIAPGPVLYRDDDSNGTYEVAQQRDTGAQQVDSENYLDTFTIFNDPGFTTFDNAVFNNGESGSGDDGFIMGPIYDITRGTVVINDQLVNDQLIIITADEVIAMAEKATLEVYRTAILDYLDEVDCTGETPDGSGTDEILCVANGGAWNAECIGEIPVNSGTNQALCVANGGTWNRAYPWLYNYADVDGLSIYYPVAVDPLGIPPGRHDFDKEKLENLGNVGRIPSIFGEYFGSGTTREFDSEVNGEFEFHISRLGPALSSEGFDIDFEDENLTLAFDDNVPWTDIGFVGLAGTGGGFTATLTDALDIPIAPLELYFAVEGHENIGGIFEICPRGGDDSSDCHMNNSGDFRDGNNDVKISVLRVSLQITIPAGTITLDTDHEDHAPTGVLITSPATDTSHARIEGKYDLTNTLGSGNMPGVIIVSADYEYDGHYHEDDTAMGDGGQASDTGSLTTLTANDLTQQDMDLTDSDLTIDLRYFPELPGWASSYDFFWTESWHSKILMAYADRYIPGSPPPLPPCVAGTDCLTIANAGGVQNDKISLLLIAGPGVWTDEGGDGLANDLSDVFDAGNDDLDSDFDARAPNGDDHLLVIEEL